MFYDPTFLLLIPAIILTIYAQFKVQSTFRRYLDEATTSSMTGAQVARDILDRYNLRSVPIELTPATLSDHYDPRARVLRLSPEVYHGRSMASFGVAAHEVGHALQHAESYAPLSLRNAIYPVASFGSNLGYFLFIIGIFLGGNTFLIDLGIILFSAFVFFTVLTLPVEFNASNRALAILSEGGYLRQGEELRGAKKVLSAAALTYVAAAAVAVINLIRMLLLRGNQDD